MDGAEVEIFRLSPFLVPDQRVAVTHVSPDGTFRVDLSANREDSYYARVRLTDSIHVKLVEAINSSVWSKDSRNDSNSHVQVDAGVIDLRKDGGTGVSECGIWHGAKAAYDDFIKTTGHNPPVYDYEILLWKTISVPYSFLSTTNWPEGYPPGPDPSAKDEFVRNRVSFHEFGHTVRHSLDGDEAHFLFDAVRFTYARFHDFCTTPTGIRATEGFGFNEGWAHFWSNLWESCESEPDNFALEGNVARDLIALSQCPAVGRSGMLRVLQQGQNIIHSEMEFRARFSALYPSCPLPSFTGASAAQALSLSPPLEHEKILANLESQFEKLQDTRNQLATQAQTFKNAACQERECVANNVKASVLDARASIASLIADRMSEDLNAVRNRTGELGDYSATRTKTLAVRVSVFRLRRKQVAQTALSKIRSALESNSSNDPSMIRIVRAYEDQLKVDTILDEALLSFFDPERSLPVSSPARKIPVGLLFAAAAFSAAAIVYLLRRRYLRSSRI
jgi:hypothetical protein